MERWVSILVLMDLAFALARALSPKTRFLIADEITTMVDAITQAQIWNIVLNIVDELNIGVLVVSHDRNLIKRLYHDTIYLKDINKVYVETKIILVTMVIAVVLYQLNYYKK